MDQHDRTRYEWLALRCQAQEPGAFEDLIAVMERPLLYYATSLTGSPDAALDVLQDTWFRAFRTIRKLRDPGSIRPWLYSIVHGIAVDHVRKSVSREQAEREQYETYDDLEEPTFAETDAHSLHRALNEISPSHREVLVLHFLEDLSLAEIAQVVGCPEGTVKSRIHHAKREVKKILQRNDHDKRK